MEYKSFIEQTFDTFKNFGQKEYHWHYLPILNSKKEIIGDLKPITYLYKQILYPNYIPLIKQWREENSIGFANRFKGTEEQTMNWIDNVLLPRKDRLLFMIHPHTADALPIGHIGYSSFNYDIPSVEIDNVVRGVKNVYKGMMSYAVNTLINYGRTGLKIKEFYLKVLSDNPHAITFYERLGFKEVNQIPLYRVEHDGMIEWIPLDEHEERRSEKSYIVMELCQ